VEFAVQITAHHRGHFELHVCEEHIGPLTPDPEGPSGCLSKWQLERVTPEELGIIDCKANDSRGDCQPLDSDYPNRWYLSPAVGVKKMTFRIPEGLQCESCTLQWRWWSANSCIPADGYGCYFRHMEQLGWDVAQWCGNGAEFCGTCPEADAPAAGSTTPAPAGASCVHNTDCGLSDWCSVAIYTSWCPEQSVDNCPSPQCVVAVAAEPEPEPETTQMPSFMQIESHSGSARCAEEFRNCADIRVVPKGSPETTAAPVTTTASPATTTASPATTTAAPATTTAAPETTTAAPATTPATTTAAPVTTTVAPATTTAAPTGGSCVRNTDCGLNAWCNDPSYDTYCAWQSVDSCPSPQCVVKSALLQAAPASRKAISAHSHGFLATALLQAGAKLDRTEPTAEL